MAKPISVRLGSRVVSVQPTLLDRAISYLAPVHGARRMHARFSIEMASGGYGTHRKRRNLGEWKPSHGDADADLLPDLPDLREESRDLARTAPIAAGIFKTKVTNVIGSGLRLNASIDREFLGIGDAQADEIEASFEREWNLFANSQECDLERTSNFAGKCREVLHSRLESGDVLAILPFVERPGSPYGLKIQVVEGDRLSNQNWAADTATCAGGIEKDAHGAPTKYWIASQHPGAYRRGATTWEGVQAFSPSGRRNVLHIFDKRRPGQSRGVPDLAPVIELVKQITRYVGAEIDAAVVSSFFTVFVKTDDGGGSGAPFAPMQPTDSIGGAVSDKDFKMGPAAILSMAPNESIEMADPTRPNAAFEQFLTAVFRMLGVAVELPFEILIKHFTASYSAAQAAIIEAWKYYVLERSLTRDQFCQPIYEALIYEAVARGRVAAPGFLTADAVVRQAWLGARWIGPGRSSINQKDDVEAAILRYENSLSTKTDETASLNGGDYEKNVRQRKREIKSEEGMPQPAGKEQSGRAPPRDGPDRERRDREDETDDESEREQRRRG